MVNTNIAERLRSARKAKGWSQAQLAEAAGLPQPEISKFERGTRRIYADDLQIIAGCLGVPPGWFLEDDDFIRRGLRALVRRDSASAEWLVEAALAIMRENRD